MMNDEVQCMKEHRSMSGMSERRREDVVAYSLTTDRLNPLLIRTI
jgi:hypothetical protein